MTAIDGLRAERMCTDSVQVVRRQHSENAQTTEVSAKFKSVVLVRCVSMHVTATEPLSGEAKRREDQRI